MGPTPSSPPHSSITPPHCITPENNSGRRLGARRRRVLCRCFQHAAPYQGRHTKSASFHHVLERRVAATPRHPTGLASRPARTRKKTSSRQCHDNRGGARRFFIGARRQATRPRTTSGLRSATPDILGQERDVPGWPGTPISAGYSRPSRADYTRVSRTGPAAVHPA